MSIPQELFGPYALTAAALIAVAVLARLHQKQDERMVTKADAQDAVVDKLATALEESTKGQTAAINQLSAELKRRRPVK